MIKKCLFWYFYFCIFCYFTICPYKIEIATSTIHRLAARTLLHFCGSCNFSFVWKKSMNSKKTLKWKYSKIRQFYVFQLYCIFLLLLFLLFVGPCFCGLAIAFAWNLPFWSLLLVFALHFVLGHCLCLAPCFGVWAVAFALSFVCWPLLLCFGLCFCFSPFLFGHCFWYSPSILFLAIASVFGPLLVEFFRFSADSLTVNTVTEFVVCSKFRDT